MTTENFAQSQVTSTNEISKFIAKSVYPAGMESVDDGERRENSRQHLPVSLLVQPLNDQGHPATPQFCTVSKDISDTGVGFLHTEPILCENLQITMISSIGEEMKVLAKLCHCSQIGSLGLLYQVGVEFVSE